MKKSSLVSIVTVVGSLSTQALASQAGGHGEVSVPVTLVISQVINLMLLTGIIWYFAGSSIRQFFKGKKESYLELMNAATKSVEDAEKRKLELANKIKNLKETFDDEVTKARNTAAENYRVMVADAKNEALKITADSEGTVQSEYLKAIENLRVETLNRSVEHAEGELTNQMSEAQQRSWNKSFGERLKGVH